MRPLITTLVRLYPAVALSAVSFLVLAPPASRAQEVTRLSWNSCRSWISEQSPIGPIIYKLVLSCIGATGLYSGHDTQIRVGPSFPIPDCWRFDADGCEGSSLISFSNAAFDQTCPAFQGTSPSRNTSYDYDASISPFAWIRLANTFNEFNAVSTQRYTLFVISFDMTYTVSGPGDPPNYCGGTEIPVGFQSLGTEFLHTDGHLTKDTTSPELFAEFAWIDCFPDWECTGAHPSTWGRVKATYR